MWCDHGEDPNACHLCLRASQPATEQRPFNVKRRSNSFPARYETICGGCGYQIEQGDQIVSLESDEHVRYCHSSCAEYLG